MAKKSLIEKELKRKKLAIQHQDKRNKLKAAIKKTSKLNEQLKLQKGLQKLPRNSAPIRIRNRCWLTGRSRGYYRDFGLSRHILREMAHNCLLPGVIKASW
uniref:Small ribosomal subunit protein uS14c n=1 Tax=Sporolithon durum TaxID=48970 RepID=A0A141SCP9_9FLOR|nr:ribosomal protein S14 [Sporolithon durum]AMK96067.1 ribosomal protein S14 [Sporolithon durum]